MVAGYDALCKIHQKYDQTCVFHYKKLLHTKLHLNPAIINIDILTKV